MNCDPREALTLRRFDLPDGWDWRWLDQVMDIQGGAQPPASTFVDQPAPGYVRFLQIRDFDSDSHPTFIRDSNRWRHALTADVLIARYGASLGRILSGKEGAYNVALAKVVPLDGTDLVFLKYLLRSNLFQAPLAGLGARSVQAGFNKADLSTIPVPIPPKSEQRVIASILGGLDEKIELNRRMNETLEAMARAIFKSWFADFDPVRAKAEGREPAAMDPDTANLFPDSFVDSAMGEIPAGWSVETVGGIADTSRESLNPQGSPEERFALFSIPAFDDGRVPALAAGSSIHSNKLLVPPGSVLVSKLNPRIPRVWRPGVFLSRGIASTEFVIMTPKPECPRDVLFAIVSSQPFCERLAELVTGTSGSHQRARAEDLLQVPFAFPPPPVATSFSRIASPMFDRIDANLRESQVLATLRDSLLPKLLSGAVRRVPIVWKTP